MIRPATKSDIPALINLLGEILKLHHGFRPDIYKEEGTKYTEAELASKMDAGELLIYVKELDQKVVAHLMCQIMETSEDIRCYHQKALYIDDLCVDAHYKHQGIGKELLMFAKDLAKEKGCYNITLHVDALNQEAIKFYEACGLKASSYTMEEII